MGLEFHLILAELFYNIGSLAFRYFLEKRFFVGKSIVFID